MCTNGRKCLFHSLIPFKNVQIFKGVVKFEMLFSFKDGYWLLLSV